MDNQIQIIIDDTCCPASVLETLGQGIRVLSKYNPSDETDQKTIKWLEGLLASGIPMVADMIRN